MVKLDGKRKRGNHKIRSSVELQESAQYVPFLYNLTLFITHKYMHTPKHSPTPREPPVLFRRQRGFHGSDFGHQ